MAQAFRDVYVNARVKDSHLLRVEGAALLLPEGAAITGRSAALLWGANLGDLAEPVEVLSPRRFGPVLGVTIRSGRLDPSDVTTRWGIPVCTAVHTSWEIARTLPEFDAVAWIDALTRVRRISSRDLVSHAALHMGEIGSVRASGVLRLCDPRAESPPESHLRLHLHKAGFVMPIPQYRIMVDGFFVARVDFAWPEVKLAVEYDGQWHGDGDQLTRDRQRFRDLNAAGWYVYPVTRQDMRDVPRLLAGLERVIKELSSRSRTEGLRTEH